MIKLADISAFERLQSGSGQSDMAVFNADTYGMSDLSDRIYDYIRDAANSIVDRVLTEYQRPDISEYSTMCRLQRVLGWKYRECGDVFGKFMYERIVEIVSKHSGLNLKPNWAETDEIGKGVPVVDVWPSEDETE